MGQIQDHFDKIIKNAISVYAKQYNVTKEKLQVQLYLKPVVDPLGTFEAGYKVCVEYKPQKELQVIDLIHPGKWFKIDFTGMSQLVHPFVGKILLELAQENHIERSHLNILCRLMTKDEREKIVLFLYDQITPIKRLDSAAVFNDEKLVI
jgi:hypothetical protein